MGLGIINISMLKNSPQELYQLWLQVPLPKTLSKQYSYNNQDIRDHYHDFLHGLSILRGISVNPNSLYLHLKKSIPRGQYHIFRQFHAAEVSIKRDKEPYL